MRSIRLEGRAASESYAHLDGPLLRGLCISGQVRFGTQAARICGWITWFGMSRTLDCGSCHVGSGWPFAHRLRLMAIAASVMAQVFRTRPRYLARAKP